MARPWSSQGSAARPPKLRHIFAPSRDIAAMHCPAMDGGYAGPNLRGALVSLGRCRQLAKDWEKSVASAEAWVLIAHIRRLT